VNVKKFWPLLCVQSTKFRQNELISYRYCKNLKIVVFWDGYSFITTTTTSTDSCSLSPCQQETNYSPFRVKNMYFDISDF